MPSYKEHVLVAIIMVFPFFPNIFYIALAVIGASIIDMDHKVNQKNITIIGLLGVILALILYIFHFPYLVGVLIALMALLFYVSEHRGLMHSHYWNSFHQCMCNILCFRGTQSNHPIHEFEGYINNHLTNPWDCNFKQKNCPHICFSDYYRPDFYI